MKKKGGGDIPIVLLLWLEHEPTGSPLFAAFCRDSQPPPLLTVVVLVGVHHACDVHHVWWFSSSHAAAWSPVSGVLRLYSAFDLLLSAALTKTKRELQPPFSLTGTRSTLIWSWAAWFDRFAPSLESREWVVSSPSPL